MTLRSNHPEYSWWKAFWLTIKSGGGDHSNDNVSGSSLHVRRRKSNQKVINKIRQNHLERMSSIRQSRRQSIFDSVNISSLHQVAFPMEDVEEGETGACTGASIEDKKLQLDIDEYGIQVESNKILGIDATDEDKCRA